MTAQPIPNATSLLDSAAKAQEASGGLMGAAMRVAGEQSETVKTGFDLVSQFKTLGMGSEMIPKFTEVAEDYLKQGKTPDTGDLLVKALAEI
ncbi:MAG: hypothetical protein ACI9Y1_000520 [Lentisphaeria bacterium]